MKFAAVILLLLLLLCARAAGDQLRLDHREGTTGNFAPVNLTTAPGNVLTFDAGGNPVIAAPAAGGVALGDSPTWTGAHTFSKAGVASTPSIRVSGLPFTGGTATTTKPLLLIEPSGTTSTGWSTSGTFVGVNAPSGFAGNLIDAQINGGTRFKVGQTASHFFGAGGINDYLTIYGGSTVPVIGASANATGTLWILADIGNGTAARLAFGNLAAITWQSTQRQDGGSVDLALFRLGANNLRQGNSPSATPLAQTLTLGEASRPGTDTNTAGASGTIQSGLGTGTGTASSLIFQTPTVAASGSATQTYATRLTLNATAATFTGTVDMSAATVLLGTATGLPVEFCVAMSDETTAITTGTAKVTMRSPYAFTVTSLRASVNTVSSSGIPTVDINEAGTTIISTKLTIDASEKTSVTAAAAYVISDAAIADDAELTFDIDVAGTGAKGLKVWVYGRR